MSGTSDPKRYAILFAGTGDRWTLNDLENCYRLLVTHYGFRRQDVSVFYFDGTLAASDGERTKFWPDNTSGDAYQIKIDGAGTAANFRAACGALAGKLKSKDKVFVHLNGHGGFDTQVGEAHVMAFNGLTYGAGQFCVDLASLPKYASLLITMQQCFGGGFVPHVIAAKNNGDIQAKLVSMACASAGVSYPNSDKSFDCFFWGWVAAHWRTDPFGKPLMKPLVFSGVAQAHQAYSYARSVKDPGDTSRQSNRPFKARKIRLA